MNVLNVNNISKKISPDFKIKDFKMRFDGGVIYSLIGPNGAGKTSLFGCLSGIAGVDSGTVLLNEMSVRESAAKKYIGYFPDNRKYFPRLTILEVMREINRIKYHDKEMSHLEELLVSYELWNYRNKLIQSCSLGMIKKLEICISFLGRPQLILLDEPTNGVDTSGLLRLKDDILNARDAGSILIISSHVLDFIRDVSDENIFIKSGSVVHTVSKGEDLEGIYRKLYIA